MARPDEPKLPCLGRPSRTHHTRVSRPPRAPPHQRGIRLDQVPPERRTLLRRPVVPDQINRLRWLGVILPVAFILALAHRIPTLDRLVREGRWDERMRHPGTGIEGRTLGLVGVGNIGRELFRLVQPFGMRHLACDPHARAEDLKPLGIELAGLESVVAAADFLVIACPLDDTTRGMIDARVLALMKPSAFLINTARGPIVDERALHHVLATRRIAGAALDVFEQEPTPVDNPLLALDNVIVTPHAVSYTDEGLRRLAEGGFRSARDFFNRRVPFRVVNPELLATPALRSWFGT